MWTFRPGALGGIRTQSARRHIRSDGRRDRGCAAARIAAIVCVLALAIGWWTFTAFVGLSLLVGLVIRRDRLLPWVVAQPLVGSAATALTAAAWAARFFV